MFLIGRDEPAPGGMIIITDLDRTNTTLHQHLDRIIEESVQDQQTYSEAVSS